MTENFFDITHRVAVVVGGTSGLGRAIAVGLARAGAHVVPSGRRTELISEVCDEIQQLGRDTVRCAVDISNRRSIDNLLETVVNHFGRVDILVNAAGRTARRATAEVDEEDWAAIMDTNLTGMLRTCQSFYKTLKAIPSASIINIASLASFVAFHEVAAYGASKAGVLSLTRSLGSEWAPDGIRVNAIVPGVFPTELNENLLEGTQRGRELLMRTPMCRFGRPEELIGATVFLASDAASFITGQSIAVDGGFLASGVNS